MKKWTLALLGSLFVLNIGASDRKVGGIGIYPGAENENFAPTLVSDYTYRNLALHRAAYQSSSYDYNLTAQLITDGVVETEEPVLLWAYANGTLLPKREREWAIDGGEYTRNTLMGEKAQFEYHWQKMRVDVDSVEIVCQMAYRPTEVKSGYSIGVQTKRQNGDWVYVGRVNGDSLPGRALRRTIPSDPNKQTGDDRIPARSIHVSFSLNETSFDNLRLNLRQSGAVYWVVTELNFFRKGERVTGLLPSSAFSSSWMSLGGGEQWVYVDLGSECSFDEVRLHWVHRAQSGLIEESDDKEEWRAVATLLAGNALENRVSCKGKGRYVRVRMLSPDASGYYTLSEMEVMGRGGLVPVPRKECAPCDAALSLNGGNWRMVRNCHYRGEEVSTPGFDADKWIVATVPATVLTNFVNIGAIPNPNVADNLFCVSESYFNASFIYRREFTVPKDWTKKHVFLNMDGINWKADIFMNGRKIDRIEGAFCRGRVEITPYLHTGTNILAVEIEPNAHPGAIKEKNEQNTDFNGGILGADNPTFHATIGWDWISTIRGRNIGIWNDVYLTTSGSVSVHNPNVQTLLNLPDTLATITPQIMLHNAERNNVQGILRGWIGDIHFEKDVVIRALSDTLITFSPDEFPQLRARQMNLWWPNGYGSPYLYDAGFSFDQERKCSDSIHYKVGIRQFHYADTARALKIYVNGRRFIPLGGNWGFSENNLNYRGREYNIAVRYHRDMNFNTIRNWVGQTGDEEFYEACDRYGIVVWQDFWLANPSDGPDPQDERMFLRNAYDYILKIRNHPSVGLYCGRNEGYPPLSLDTMLRKFVGLLHPGICYISSSADEGVSGHGPYYALPAQDYFNRQTGKLHTERGMPCVMNIESLKRTLSPEALWPQQKQWGQHDYVMAGAQRGAEFNRLIERHFGHPQTATDFTTLAQWINYDGYRAMFESDSKHRMGLLLWMSHPCWPSMTWQTYDYYFEPTAAYFGCKKACEPLHVQYNAATHRVEVVNRICPESKVRVEANIYSLSGNVLEQKSCVLTIPADSTAQCMQIPLPETDTDVRLLRLCLIQDGKVLSTNDYMLTAANGSLRALNHLSKPRLKIKTLQVKDAEAKVRITALGESPALRVRVNLKGSDGEQILPVIYSDNYFHLLPGESRTIKISWNKADSRGRKPQVEVSCFEPRERL